MNAAFEGQATGARQTGMGSAGVAISGNGVAGCRNIALAAGEPVRFEVGWSQDFSLPELSREFATATVPYHRLAVLFMGESFGSELYRESMLKLGVAHRANSKLAVGAAISGLFLDVKGYSGASGVSSEFGITADATERMRVGAAWRNPGRPKLSGIKDRLPESLTVGMAVETGTRAVIAADVVHERHFPMEWRLGAEAFLHPSITMRVGARGEIFRPAAGLSVRVSRWVVHYGGDLHPDLGASHSVGLEFTPK